MSKHIVKVSSVTQKLQNEMKKNLIAQLQDETVWVKRVTWNDLGCGDHDDMQMTIDFQTIDGVIIVEE